MPLNWVSLGRHGRRTLTNTTVAVGKDVWLTEDGANTSRFAVLEDHGPVVRRLVHGHLRRHQAVFEVEAGPDPSGCRSLSPWVTGVTGFRGQAEYRFACDLAHRSGALTVTSKDYSVTMTARARVGLRGNLLPVPADGALSMERRRVVIKTTSDPDLLISLVAPWTASGPDTLLLLLEEEVGQAAAQDAGPDIVARGKGLFLPELPPPSEWPVDRLYSADASFGSPGPGQGELAEVSEPLVIPRQGVSLSLGEDDVWQAELGIPVPPEGFQYMYAINVVDVNTEGSGVFTPLQLATWPAGYYRDRS